MKLTSIKFFIFLVLFYSIEWTLGVYYLPQQAEVTYLNEKYAYNTTSFIKRYGRKSPYYYNIHAGIKHTWGNNITIHIVLFESVTLNQYKRNFFEIHLKLCDMIERDPYLGKAVNIMLSIHGITCPIAPGEYKFYNVTLPNMPNIINIQKGKLEGTIYQLPTNDVIGVYYLPQRTEVTYVNEKYAYNGKAFIKQYGRKSPYFNLEQGIYHTWGNNITLHLMFLESQQLNQYKRSVFEIHLKLCDLLAREPYFGKTLNIVLAKRGISCPMKAGMYILHNLTLPSMPNMLSIQKGKVEATFRQLPTNDVITTGYVTFVIKERYK